MYSLRIRRISMSLEQKRTFQIETKILKKEAKIWGKKGHIYFFIIWELILFLLSDIKG